MQDFTKYDQKLEFILRNAARIFAEKNYHSTTMRDISRATNVSLAGLYHYCKSKEELLFLIQDNCFGRVLERLEERLREVVDPLNKLRIFIDNHLSFFAANMAEMKVLSHEAESLAGDLHTHVSTKKEKYTRLARKILKELQQQQAGNRGSSPTPGSPRGQPAWGGAVREGVPFNDIITSPNMATHESHALANARATAPEAVGRRRHRTNSLAGHDQIDLTVATYALFGMMNWIYNWYDPHGKLKVSELVDNVTRLFLRGFVAGPLTEELDVAPKATRETMSVWRGSL